MRIVYQRKEALRRLICLTLVFLLFSVGFVMIHQEAKDLLPEGVEFVTDGFSPSELAVAQGAYPSLTISAYQEESGFVERNRDSGLVTPANLRYVDDAYFVVTEIAFAAGGLYTAATKVEEAQAVIISETLAQEYYFTNQAVGQTLWINGQPYTVVAVYREPTSVLHRISGDGLETLYLPLSGKQDGMATQTHVLIPDESGGAVSENALHNLNAALDGALFRSVRYNNTELRQRLEQLFRCYVFLFAAILAVFLVRLALRGFERLGTWYRDKEYEEVSHREMMPLILPPVLCLLAAAGVLALARFPLIIPAEYLPMDGRLLNLSHYVDVFVERTISRNTASYRYADTVYRYAIWGIHLFGIAAAGTLSALLCDLRHLTGSKEDI